MYPHVLRTSAHAINQSGAAITVCPYDGGILPRAPWPQEGATVLGKGYRGGGSCFLDFLHWERQYHILFLHLALVQWEGMTSELSALPLSKHFICFCKGP